MIAATWITQHVTIFQAMQALNVYDGGDEATRQMLCPVHADTTPSARVYAEENRVHCFTCGRGWDVLGLVMAVRHVAYPQAGEWLIETFGLSARADLPSQVRATLAMPAGTLQPLFQYAEHAVRSAKRRLTCEQFGKVTMALDLVTAQYRDAPDRERAARDIKRVLKHVEGIRS